MPHIAVNLYPGRDFETKQDIADRVAKLIVQEFGFSEDGVSVSIVEIPKEDFPQTIKDRYSDEELFVPSALVDRA